jgi:hypothetical protein
MRLKQCPFKDYSNKTLLMFAVHLSPVKKLRRGFKCARENGVDCPLASGRLAFVPKAGSKDYFGFLTS